MESILVLTHADETGSALTKASLEAVTAGKELAPTPRRAANHWHRRHARRCGESRRNAAQTLLAVCGEAFAQPRFATDAAACEALCRAANATIVLAPQSSRFARVMAGSGASAGRLHRHAHHLRSAAPTPWKPHAGSIASASKLSLGAPRAPGSCFWIPARTQPYAGESARQRASRARLPSMSSFPSCARTVTGIRAPKHDEANHPPRRKTPLCRRRRLDQEAA